MITDQQSPSAPSDGTSSEQHGPHMPRPRPLIIISMAVLLVAVIAGAVWGFTRSNGAATTTARATATATATRIPQVVYQADWSHGANGWTLPAQTKIVDGHLLLDLSDSTALASLQIPYVPTTPNYAVEMDFQLEGLTVGGHFGFTGRDATGTIQYAGEVACTPMHQGSWTPDMGSCPGAVYVNTRGSKDSGSFASDYVINPGPQTFRLEVTDGNTVTFCPVNDCLLSATSTQPYPASLRIFIEDRGVKLLITRVTVTTL